MLLDVTLLDGVDGESPLTLSAACVVSAEPARRPGWTEVRLSDGRGLTLVEDYEAFRDRWRAALAQEGFTLDDIKAAHATGRRTGLRSAAQWAADYTAFQTDETRRAAMVPIVEGLARGAEGEG